jgi:hypothetical protein
MERQKRPMTSHVRTTQFVAAGVTAVALAVFPACAHEGATDAPAAAPAAATPAPATAPVADAALAAPTVPDQLRAPAGEVVSVKASAQGTQDYECKAGDGGTFAWKLVAPNAELSDTAGKPLGKHYAGPTWESVDGSKVVGELAQKADAPGGQAIPWLILKAKSTSGTGVFAKVTSVQRIDTTGGLAPTSGCDSGHAGARQSVAYRATYYFYTAR